MLQFFEHNTVPRYAVIIEGAKLSKDVKDAIMQYFGQHVKGKAHKTLIIPIPAMRGEVKLRFEKLAADAQEGSFQDTRKNNAQGIMTAHGVSPAIIGIAESSELGSGKGLSQAEIYKDRIVTPSQRVWEHHLNRLLKLGLGTQLIRLKFNPLDIRDREAEKTVFLSYLEKGVMTINQVAKRLGLAPVEGGDRNFILSPQGPIFVDELTQAAGVEKQALEDQIEELKSELDAPDITGDTMPVKPIKIPDE
jgi:capsid portal protein